MYCVYRVCMKEHIPGFGWVDDGYIYSAEKYLVEKERDRRLQMHFQEAGSIHASSPEIVVINETFLTSLKTTPVLSTVKGTHPADQGLLSDRKAAIKKKVPIRRPVRNTNALLAVL